jgi:hypothetical protein
LERSRASDSDGDAKAARRARDRRDLWRALAGAAAGAIGALPVHSTARPDAALAPDPLVLLAWLALVAPACGCALAGIGLTRAAFAAAVPGAWMIVLALADGASRRDLASPLWGSLAIAGLYFGGAAIGRALARRALPLAAALLIATALLAVLPGRARWAGSPWPPRVASALLDLSPVTFAAESAGVDWSRHASVYATVETDRFERASYRGALAGPVALVLGCAAFLAAARAKGAA